MRRALDAGLSAAEAARTALERDPAGLPPPGGSGGPPRRSDPGLRRGGRTRRAGRQVDSFGVEEVLRDVILPALEQVGDDWQRGSIDISQEHFVSNLIRGRLLALARLWGREAGRSRSSHARPASSTTSRSSRSGSFCARTAGASCTSAPIRRSRRWRAPPIPRRRLSLSSRPLTLACSRRTWPRFADSRERHPSSWQGPAPRIPSAPASVSGDSTATWSPRRTRSRPAPDDPGLAPVPDRSGTCCQEPLTTDPRPHGRGTDSSTQGSRQEV